MKLAIITHVSHGQQNAKYFAYGPYVREMNVWLQYADSAIIVAPMELTQKAAIDLSYEYNVIQFFKVPSFDLKSAGAIIKTIFALPAIVLAVFRAMKAADHIHLRCPGNMGLIGCLVQILFPNKKKSAKYAGNWDPKSAQPWSYRFQKWILNSTILTKNMQVLVYGEWDGASKNIKPFFTATYNESDKSPVAARDFSGIVSFLFVGTLSEGKQPLYALKLVEQLSKLGVAAQIDFYGEGKERVALQTYIDQNNLGEFAQLLGNKDEMTIRKAFHRSHFLVLPSKSEGWPKVVAEAMFWGSVPVAAPVSCVPYMLAEGSRGVLLSSNIETDVKQLNSLIQHPDQYNSMAEQGISWSRQFTLDLFSSEIKSLLQK